MAVGTHGTSLASDAADVEEDADDFASQCFVDPLVVLVEDQSGCGSLVLFLVVSATTEVASKVAGGGWLLRLRRGGKRLPMKSPTVGVR